MKQISDAIIFVKEMEKAATRKSNSSIFAIPKQRSNSPGGEIGRRTVFRSQRSQGCAGSNPVLGTKKEKALSRWT